NILRKAEAFLLEREPTGATVKVSVVGRKARDYYRRRRRDLRKSVTDLRGEPTFELAADIGNELIASFVEGETDEVWLLYSEFRSAISQRPTLRRILPLSDLESREGAPSQQAAAVDYKYEPSAEALLDDLLPRYVHVQVLRALL